MYAPVLLNALLFGSGMSLLLVLIVLLSLRVNPAVGLKDYPPAVLRKGRKNLPHDTQKHRYTFGIPFLLVVIGAVVLAALRIPHITGGEFNFTYAFLTAAVMLMLFNLVDLLVIDWLLGMVVQPGFMVLPGTAGMSAYQDFEFYGKSFLRTSLMVLLYSVAFGAFAMAVYTLTG
jgi:hypothetical protein